MNLIPLGAGNFYFVYRIDTNMSKLYNLDVSRCNIDDRVSYISKLPKFCVLKLPRDTIDYNIFKSKLLYYNEFKRLTEDYLVDVYNLNIPNMIPCLIDYKRAQELRNIMEDVIIKDVKDNRFLKKRIDFNKDLNMNSLINININEFKLLNDLNDDIDLLNFELCFIVEDTLHPYNLNNYNDNMMHMSIELKLKCGLIQFKGIPNIFQLKQLKNAYDKSQINYTNHNNCICNPPEVQYNSSFPVASPPEVTTTVPLAVEASSNYLSLKSRATPRDRGRSIVKDVTSSGSGKPVADLREAKGELNKGSCLQDKGVKDVTSSGENGVIEGYGDKKPHNDNNPHNSTIVPDDYEYNTSSGIPESDLWELEGDVNRGSCLQDERCSDIGPQVEPVADHREAKGKINKKATTASGNVKTTSGGVVNVISRYNPCRLYGMDYVIVYDELNNLCINPQNNMRVFIGIYEVDPLRLIDDDRLGLLTRMIIDNKLLFKYILNLQSLSCGNEYIGYILYECINIINKILKFNIIENININDALIKFKLKYKLININPYKLKKIFYNCKLLLCEEKKIFLLSIYK